MRLDREGGILSVRVAICVTLSPPSSGLSRPRATISGSASLTESITGFEKLQWGAGSKETRLHTGSAHIVVVVEALGYTLRPETSPRAAKAKRS
jgi:hypothetical protein